MKKWDKDEEELLKIWLGQGWTHSDIAKELDTTDCVVKYKANLLGLKSLNNTKKTHEEFILEMTIINKDIDILGKYINNKTAIKLKCLIDNNIWHARPKDLLSGKGCPICAHNANLGGYQTMTNEQLNILDYPLYLYHVKLQYENEVFYKYGLTKNKNRTRYNGYGRYKVIEEISFEKYNALVAVQKERECISNYKPKYKFSGWSECYV